MAKNIPAVRMDEDFNALALLEAAGLKVTHLVDGSQALTDGWVVLSGDEKGQLVNVPLVMVDYRFTDSDKFRDENGQPRGFVVIKLVTNEFISSGGDRGKYVITDGGAGIYKQLGEWVEREGIDMKADAVPGLVCKQGLKASTYDYVAKDGSSGEATTWYVA